MFARCFLCLAVVMKKLGISLHFLMSIPKEKNVFDLASEQLLSYDFRQINIVSLIYICAVLFHL